MMAADSEGRSGLLVIERVQWNVGIPATTQEVGTVGALSPVEIVRRYKGIAGQPWPEEETLLSVLGGEEELLYNGLAPPAEYTAVRDYYTRVSQTHTSDFLYCNILAGWHKTQPVALPSPFSFCGYDYGYYLGAYNNFSAIHNDVINGRYDVLRAFETQLNDYLLLPSLPLVQRLDEARKQLIEKDALLETDEDFGPIAVYGHQL